MSGLILPHHGVSPELSGVLYVAPNATVIGDVVAGPGCSFWFGSVTRGDVNTVRIGQRTNIQDLSMLHVSYKKSGLVIGDDVTVGHSCLLHACTVGNRVLVGMGSILMDQVQVADDVIVGAGSLLTEGFHAPPRTLVLGRPGKVVRALTDAELAFIARSASHYMKVAQSYTGGPWPYAGDLHER